MKTEPTYPIDLITSYFAGEASSDDLEFLAQWMKADPEHQEIFESYRKTWNEIEKERIGSQVDLDLGWHELKKRMDVIAFTQLEQEPVSIDNSRQNRYFTANTFRIAALFLLFAVPTLFIYIYFSKSELKKLTSETAMVEGTLPDGTAVTLNTGSSLEYPAIFRGHKRSVSLTGEAYFEVAHDKTKPFIITSGNVRVEVLGTSFYVNTNSANGRMEVILANGQVAVYYDDKATEKVILAPGEKADITLDEHGIVKKTNDDPNYISWKTRKLIFTNEPLGEIVATLGKVYHARVRITNPALSQCRITATFDNQTLQSVLNVLSATLNVRIIQNGGWTEISGNGCN